MVKIKLEHATPHDYVEFIRFYNDLNLNLIYTWNGINHRETVRQDDDFFEGFDFPEYSFDEFQSDLFSECHRIYMIRAYDTKKRETNTIGYIHMMYCAKKEYRLFDWAMTLDEYKNIVWKQLLDIKFPRCRKISVYMGGSDETKEWLKSLGFSEHSSHYGCVEIELAKSQVAD